MFAAIEANPTRDVNDGYVAWLRNDGAQNFTQSVLVSEIRDDFRVGTISNRQGKVSVVIADMDGDGDLDLITNTDANVYGAEWWENDGGVDPALVDDHLIKVQGSIDDDEGMLGPFEVHDIDRDGLMDVVANYKYWFKQRPNGAFQTEYVSNGGEDMIFGVIDDVNGDGHLDVFVNEGVLGMTELSYWYRMYAWIIAPRYRMPTSSTPTVTLWVMSASKGTQQMLFTLLWKPLPKALSRSTIGMGPKKHAPHLSIARDLRLA